MNDQTLTDDFARRTGPQTLVIQRWLPGPAERLWRYLTEADLRRKWLADGAMVPEPGATFELVWRNAELGDTGEPRPEGLPEEHRLTSRIIAADPPRRLSFTWGEGEVTFDLAPQGDRVRLTITHRLGTPQAIFDVAPGWHQHLDLLAAVLADAPVPAFWSGYRQLKEIYAARLAD